MSEKLSGLDVITPDFTDVSSMRKRVNFTRRRPWKCGARRATRADCVNLGEVINYRTFYGNWRGSRAVQQFKCRFTRLCKYRRISPYKYRRLSQSGAFPMNPREVT